MRADHRGTFLIKPMREGKEGEEGEEEGWMTPVGLQGVPLGKFNFRKNR